MPVETVRIDRWLSAARIFKSRTQAAEGCTGGHVRLNGQSAKPHHALRVGDALEVRRGERQFVLEVVALADKRLGAPAARELYLDHSPPPPKREKSPVQREPGAGRPTKRDRRRLGRLRGR